MVIQREVTFSWDLNVITDVPEKALERALATSVVDYLRQWCEGWTGDETGGYVLMRSLVGPVLTHKHYPDYPRPNIDYLSDEELAELERRTKNAQRKHPHTVADYAPEDDPYHSESSRVRRERVEPDEQS